VQNHQCHVEFLIRFTDAEIAAKATFEPLAVSALIEAGAFFSRPYGAAVVPAFTRDPGSTALHMKMKQVFDPAGVLNRGKWPLTQIVGQS
jgi:FAD/FMN-containing dehydrogenase